MLCCLLTMFVTPLPTMFEPPYFMHEIFIIVFLEKLKLQNLNNHPAFYSVRELNTLFNMDLVYLACVSVVDRCSIVENTIVFCIIRSDNYGIQGFCILLCSSKIVSYAHDRWFDVLKVAGSTKAEDRTIQDSLGSIIAARSIPRQSRYIKICNFVNALPLFPFITGSCTISHNNTNDKMSLALFFSSHCIWNQIL